MLVCYFMPSGLFMLGQMSISHILKKKGVTDAYMLRVRTYCCETGGRGEGFVLYE